MDAYSLKTTSWLRTNKWLAHGSVLSGDTGKAVTGAEFEHVVVERVVLRPLLGNVSGSAWSRVTGT